MTVRWKPLMILSGLFLVVALVGVVAITVTLMPRSAQGILKVARAAREAGRFKDAEIYYKQALQVEPRNAAIHEDFAGLYRDWAGQAEGDQRAALRAERLAQLNKAVNFDKAARGPRKDLLHDAMDQDLALDAIYWAKELLNVEPDDLDAHYVLAAEALEERAPNVPEIKRHLEVLEKAKAPAVRRLWIRARLAELAGDDSARAAALAEARAIAPGAEPDAVDRFARLRLTALEVRSEADAQRLAEPVARLREQVKGLGKPEELPPERVARLRSLLEQTQRSLTARSAKLAPDGQEGRRGPGGCHRGGPGDRVPPGPGRGPPARPQDVPRVRRPPAAPPPARPLPGGDRSRPEIAPGDPADVDARRDAPALGGRRHDPGQDRGPARFDKAGPHVQALLESSEPRYQALGHLFAGSIDLDRSGLAREMTGVDDGPAGRQARPKLRGSALNHLKLAAAGLPDIAEAQAKYGVALVLAQEQNLGRQYLQTALRLGSLEPQYQLWAAWTILQAGYPEEAEPIVQSLLRQVEQGGLPREMEGTLHLLRGELHQARRGPDDLKKAVEEFDKALAAGQAVTPTPSCGWRRSTSSSASTTAPWRGSARSVRRARGARRPSISPC